MTITDPLPLVPNAVYRIRSAARDSPALYLERKADGEVRPAELDASNPNQKWTITSQPDGSYQIASFESGAALSILSYEEEGKTKSRIYSGGHQSWTLDARGNQFIIGNPDNTQCVDIALNNWVIMWERNNALNQRWLLDSIDALPSNTGKPDIGSTQPEQVPGALLQGGMYDLVNVQSGSYAYALSASGRMWIQLVYATRRFDHRLTPLVPWKIEPLGENNYTISAESDSAPTYGALFIPEEDPEFAPGTSNRTVARCELAPRGCFLFPVSGSSDTFNIVAESAGQPRKVLYDGVEGPYGCARFGDLVSCKLFSLMTDASFICGVHM